MKIAIVDDIPKEAETLSAFLHEYETQNQIRFELDCYTSAEEILQIIQPGRFDLIFMDIYMGGMNGIEAAEKIRAADENVLLSFLTTSREHMPEAFHLHVYDYILKPAEKKAIFRLLDDASDQIRKQTSLPTLTFISHRNEYSLLISEIVSVISSANYLEITGENGSVYKPRMTFAAASEELCTDPRFLLINRGILVNMDYVVMISDDSCQMQNGTVLPLNVKNRRKLEQAWLKYTIAKIRHDSMERRFS